VTRLDFIRHGRPEGGSKYRGSAVDDPLSAEGWRQMWRAVGDHCHWDGVITSPLRRCHEFAQALAERHHLPLEVEADFREVGFGCWEGRTRAQLQAEDPQGYAAFYADPVNRRPAGAEDLHAFGRRVARAFEAAVARHPEGRWLVVAHAGVIRAALGHVLQAPPAAWYRVAVDNAGLSRFECQGEQRKLIFHNRADLPA